MLKSTINYDETIKTIIAYLNGYCNVPTQKVAEFLNCLTDQKINISNATVTNSIAQFSKKSEGNLEKIKKYIMKQPTIYEDETPITVNGKKMSSIGVFTKDVSCIGAFENRTYETFEKMRILNKFIGTVCHDHNIIHQSFNNYKDAECNFHILRYCKAEFQVHERECIKEFINHMLLLRDEVDKRKSENLSPFTDEEYREAKIKYLAILSKWDDEYNKTVKNPKSEYHKTERCLKARLREFADDHLRFLKDFTIDFTNNLAKRRT